MLSVLLKLFHVYAFCRVNLCLSLSELFCCRFFFFYRVCFASSVGRSGRNGQITLMFAKALSADLKLSKIATTWRTIVWCRNGQTVHFCHSLVCWPKTLQDCHTESLCGVGMFKLYISGIALSSDLKLCMIATQNNCVVSECSNCVIFAIALSTDWKLCKTAA